MRSAWPNPGTIDARNRTSRCRSERSMRDGVTDGTSLTRLSSRTRPPPGASPIWGWAPVPVAGGTPPRAPRRRGSTAARPPETAGSPAGAAGALVAAADAEAERRRDLLRSPAQMGGALAIDLHAPLRAVEPQRRIGVHDATELRRAAA